MPQIISFYLSFMMVKRFRSYEGRKVGQLAQIQPNSQFLLHKNLPPRDFSIMTLTLHSKKCTLPCITFPYLFDPFIKAQRAAGPHRPTRTNSLWRVTNVIESSKKIWIPLIILLKNERKNSVFWPNSTIIVLFFFWKNLRIAKSPFEINWPLVMVNKNQRET